MNMIEVLSLIRQTGGSIVVLDGDLKIKVPAGSLSADHLATIKANKATLVDLLSPAVEDEALVERQAIQWAETLDEITGGEVLHTASVELHAITCPYAPHVGRSFYEDALDGEGRIKTNCKHCRKFIGYRPAKRIEAIQGISVTPYHEESPFMSINKGYRFGAFIDGPITKESADETISDICSATPGSFLQLCVNTNGGSVEHGQRILEALESHRGGWWAYCYGQQCASMGVSIICQAKVVVSAPIVEYEVHHGRAKMSREFNSARALRDAADLVGDADDKHVNWFCAKTPDAVRQS